MSGDVVASPFVAFADDFQVICERFIFQNPNLKTTSPS
jgi:hypothetical protein